MTMMIPINSRQKRFIEKLTQLKVETDINKRWEEGIEHHDMSDIVAEMISDVDWLYCDDSFGFKFGGDGDNGEFLKYLLDIIFDMVDAETKQTCAETLQTCADLSGIVDALNEKLESEDVD